MGVEEFLAASIWGSGGPCDEQRTPRPRTWALQRAAILALVSLAAALQLALAMMQQSPVMRWSMRALLWLTNCISAEVAYCSAEC